MSDPTNTTTAEVTVKVAGGKRAAVISFETATGATVGDMLAQALVDNGMPPSAIATLYPVVNGLDAEKDDQVAPGDVIDAGVGVANG
jgi:hypothetical protein